MSEDAYNATLVRRIDISSRLAIFRIRPDAPLPEFTPGQFLVLGLTRATPRRADTEPEEVLPEKADRLVKRTYSISSASQHTEEVEFYIALVSDGVLTPRLFTRQEGDRLFMNRDPKGLFTLDRVPEGANILLVATGTGLAPYMSMLRSLALGEGGPSRPMAVLHGAAFSWDLGYRNDLEALQHACPRFRYIPVVSRPREDTAWSGLTGRLTPWLEDLPALSARCGFTLVPGECHIFLCGHPQLVEDGLRILGEQGFDPGKPREPGTLHAERYW
ncbi:MAG: ferredoxin--NADP reductase [Magnetococcales bacterium]|nr:ferredoxin--NADP reductase [Magnetococcales bacterium]